MSQDYYRAAEIQPLKRTPCHLTTHEHLRNFVGMFFYIFTGYGELSLFPNELVFQVKGKGQISIPLPAIDSIQVGHFPRIAKPIRTDFLEIRYRTEGGTKSLLVTPTRSQASPIWTMNALVAEWARTLQDYTR